MKQLLEIMKSTTAYIALGSNLGDRNARLEAAVDLLTAASGIVFVRESSRRLTEPVGGPSGQEMYLNSVCRVETVLGPRELLAATQGIERRLGRRREEEAARWGPRAIDLDILVLGDTVMDEPGLTIPHPRLAERVFVLEPLAEIAPGLVVPGVGSTPTELLRKLTKQ